MIQTGRRFLSGLSICYLLIANRCSYLDSTTVSSDFTLPEGSDSTYQLTKRFFLLFPGDSALLCGTRACMTVSNNDTSFQNDSLYFRTITHHPSFMTTNGTKRLVFPQEFQQAGSLDKLEHTSITRFFEIRDTAILQIAFELNKDTIYLDKNIQKVIPIIIEVGSYNTIHSPNNTWPASPLIKNPINATGGTLWFQGQNVAAKALAVNWGEYYYVNGYGYQFGIRIKTYYSINGYATENNMQISVIGTITIERSYFKDIGLVDQKMSSSIVKRYSDGTEKTIKESLILERGSDGATIYDDWDIPDTIIIGDI